MAERLSLRLKRPAFPHCRLEKGKEERDVQLIIKREGTALADHTHIQWSDASWNPVVGCIKVSEGCRNCYAIRDGHRMAGNPNVKLAATYGGLTLIQNGRLNWTGVVKELPERLDQPCRWKKPRRIFVNSQSDLFHDQVSAGFIDQVGEVMRRCPQHTFQILTKRPARMRYIVDLLGWRSLLPHVWLGVSVEDQQTADERIPLLLETPAAVRCLSCEPLLGPVDLKQFLADFELSRSKRGNLHWVIIGGESGPGARPMELPWIRSLIAACRESQVACFVKQLGSYWSQVHGAGDRKGGEPAEWPADLRVREFPVP